MMMFYKHLRSFAGCWKRSRSDDNLFSAFRLRLCIQEYNDVELTSYLSELTNSLAVLNDVSR